MKVHSGITRHVLVGRRLAVKWPSSYQWFVRGWLANRSEWKQRDRVGVNRPLVTLGHVVLVVRSARVVPDNEWASGPWRFPGEEVPWADGDEAKVSSWGWFASGWRLIDFDRAWEHPRGLVGSLYYGRQERLARKWAGLPALEAKTAGS